ncbi:hypothetical protein TRVL_01905 [Trypanosoma vivax]|uniref:Uncharacterized protein n=1 Tax=Trypanosoma vivax (strain Y486) TaxID=1055687 RepID=G0U726_TRYVY|nr:hypothetical protein TRVL_01905 [Trypanosoma vivax]CCC51683.1 conserved hypothetical protein [Trypanosoma vivax Y486]
MHRKPFLESVWQMPSPDVLTVITAVIGAVSIYLFLLKDRRSGRRREGTTTDSKLSFLNRMRDGQFKGRKMCISWEVLVSGGEWRNGAREALVACASDMVVHLMCHIKNDDEKGNILSMIKDIKGLERHRILFCSTAKGYDAFCRQIKPFIAVTHDEGQASFLGDILASVVLVGSTVSSPSVTCVSAFSELLHPS